MRPIPLDLKINSQPMLRCGFKFNSDILVYQWRRQQVDASLTPPGSKDSKGNELYSGCCPSPIKKNGK